MPTVPFDVVVVGAGIAGGASVAAHLAASRRVALLERESQPGHTRRDARRRCSRRSMARPVYGRYRGRVVSSSTRRRRVFAEHPLVGDRYSSTLPDTINWRPSRRSRISRSAKRDAQTIPPGRPGGDATPAGRLSRRSRL